LCQRIRPGQVPNSREIFQSWIGRTLELELPNGSKAIAVFAADGTATLSGALSDAGKWRLDDDGYCASRQKLPSGRDACFTIRLMGGSFLVVFRNTNDVSAKATPK
jgi:hypothetical protein